MEKKKKETRKRFEERKRRIFKQGEWQLKKGKPVEIIEPGVRWRVTLPGVVAKALDELGCEFAGNFPGRFYGPDGNLRDFLKFKPFYEDLRREYKGEELEREVREKLKKIYVL